MVFDEQKYSLLIQEIKSKRIKGQTFDVLLSKYDEGYFEGRIRYDDWPKDSQSAWPDAVEYIRSEEEKIKKIDEEVLHSKVMSSGTTNLLTVPLEAHSSWQIYRSKLINDGFSNIDIIERECLSILQHLSTETDPDYPVKGLVAGYVQSGKTANMAGLISMAADYGWNLFIILSGTIDNLRVQTRDRLYNDLHNNFISWHNFDYLNIENHESRYFKTSDKGLNVCLKNPKRLEGLLAWLNDDLERKSKLKILLIDDEADQASINTAKPEKDRKKINDLIVKIVNCLDENGNKCGRYGSMNYVSYTATPYANFLSEGSEESLYPRDFIQLLTPSKEYFGPHIVYGDNNRYHGLSIIDSSDCIDVHAKKYAEGNSIDAPESLKDAVAWFMTSVAVFRYWNIKKPVSMLVHLTPFVKGHKAVAHAINRYLKEKESLFIRCKEVYERKTKEFTKEMFFVQYHDYGISESDVKDYPDFSEISELLRELIDYDPEHITLTADKKINYKRAVHLCVDNSTNCQLDVNIASDEKCISRIIYPDSKNSPDYATAFIVVGGNTLSRGLTIQGLVSTYFGRPSNTGDTLMQMGRWFGYRKGYELLPRIWMSPDALLSFNTVVDADESLREYIRENYDRCTPVELPPKIKQFPKTGYLKYMTSPDKSRAAVSTGYNFEGYTLQTKIFLAASEILRHNISVTENFISKIKDSLVKSEVSKSLVARRIDKDAIIQYLSEMKHSSREKRFNEIEVFTDWVKKKTYRDWNVIIASNETSVNGSWDVTSDLSINKVGRLAKEKTSDEIVLSKTTSDPKDRFADIILEDYEGEDDIESLIKARKVPALREGCKIDDVPYMIIYRISKDSAPCKPGEGIPLETEEDLIALYVKIPGVKSPKKGTYLQIPVREEE